MRARIRGGGVDVYPVGVTLRDGTRHVVTCSGEARLYVDNRDRRDVIRWGSCERV